MVLTLLGGQASPALSASTVLVDRKEAESSATTGSVERPPVVSLLSLEPVLQDDAPLVQPAGYILPMMPDEGTEEASHAGG